MADSPTLKGAGLPEATITSDGSALPDTARIRSVTVRNGYNKIPSAVVVIEDGDMPSQSFAQSDLKTFDPGSEIEIKMGYDQKTESVFKGVLLKQGVKISRGNDSRLVLECKDKAVKTTLARRNANFLKKKDSDIISQLLSDNGLSGGVAATNTRYDELVQYNCTDWDFLMARAEANAMLVSFDETGKITVGKPEASGSAVLSVEYGQDLFDFSADLDAESQLSAAASVGWSAKDQAVVAGKGTMPALNSQGSANADSTQKKLADVLAVTDVSLMSPTQLEKTALDDWASGQLLKSGLARIRGRMTIQGSAKAKVGSVIDLKGVGGRFSGNVLVSAVAHRLAEGNWLTEVEFGLDSRWFHESYAMHSPRASGLVGATDGLAVGVVKKIDSDPNTEYRAQVSVPVMRAKQDEIWARLSGFYASSGVGAFFMPEIGDEVVLGYFNNDPSQPVILGSLYSSKHKAPYEPDDKNTKKAIVSKEKLTVEFDDDKKILTITTPGENKITLSDDAKSVELVDQNSNKITLDSSGITLDSQKDIILKAAGKIAATPSADFEVNATGDFKGNGTNVNLTAKTAMTAKGNASAEISASGQTTVKGAMVMIN